MIAFPEGQTVGIFGPVASGKTHLIKTWLRTQNRFVAFDYSGEFLDDYETISQSPGSLLRRLQANRYYFQIAYVPGRDVETDFEWVLWSLWHQPVKKLLCCDEIHRICPNNGTGIEGPMEILLRFARHASVSMIGASQRVQDVHTLFRSACRTVILFWTEENNSLNAIDDTWGCGELVRSLRPLIYDDINKITKQFPQAVLCQKGKRPEVIELQ
jgi:hypothetical protein